MYSCTCKVLFYREQTHATRLQRRRRRLVCSVQRRLVCSVSFFFIARRVFACSNGGELYVSALYYLTVSCARGEFTCSRIFLRSFWLLATINLTLYTIFHGKCDSSESSGFASTQIYAAAAFALCNSLSKRLHWNLYLISGRGRLHAYAPIYDIFSWAARVHFRLEIQICPCSRPTESGATVKNSLIFISNYSLRVLWHSFHSVRPFFHFLSLFPAHFIPHTGRA